MVVACSKWGWFVDVVVVVVVVGWRRGVDGRVVWWMVKVLDGIM